MCICAHEGLADGAALDHVVGAVDGASEGEGGRGAPDGRGEGRGARGAAWN